VNAEILAVTIDNLHKRFGPNSIQRRAILLDPELSGFNHKDDHCIKIGKLLPFHTVILLSYPHVIFELRK